MTDCSTPIPSRPIPNQSSFLYSPTCLNPTSRQEFTGHYPRDITVVSFGFKQDRYESYHRAALRFPKASSSRPSRLAHQPPPQRLNPTPANLTPTPHLSHPFSPGALPL